MLAVSAIPHHHHEKAHCFNTEQNNPFCDRKNDHKEDDYRENDHNENGHKENGHKGNDHKEKNHEENDCFSHSFFNFGQKINETRVFVNESYADFILFVLDNFYALIPETKIEFPENIFSLTSPQKSNPLGLRAPPFQ